MNTHILISILALFLCCAAITTATLTDGLIGYYSFTNQINGTIIDSVTNILHHGDATSIPNGKSGSAYRFNHTSISLNPDTYHFNDAKSFSINAWVRILNNETGDQDISIYNTLNNGIDPSGMTFGLENTGGANWYFPYFLAQDASGINGIEIAGAENIPYADVNNTQDWYMLTLTYDATTRNASLYLNTRNAEQEYDPSAPGYKTTNGNGSFTSNSGTPRLGAYPPDRSSMHDADEIAFYNRTLTQNEIQTLYTTTNPLINEGIINNPNPYTYDTSDLAPSIINAFVAILISLSSLATIIAIILLVRFIQHK